MGVINVTPDSFVDDVRTPECADAVNRCRQLVDEGVHILDIGGESTRPGAEPVTIEAELERVLPVIEAIAPSLPASVKISVDTRNEPVARAAVAAGATIVNDMSATLGPVAAELEVGYVAGHMQGTPESMQQNPVYGDVVDDVLGSVVRAAADALNAGAREVWIDPGIGFGKTIEHNLEILAHVDRLVATGIPVLLGVSRKSVIGYLHGASDTRRTPGSATPTGTDDRLEGSLAIAVWAAAMGVDVVRVHDVSETIQALQVVGARNWV